MADKNSTIPRGWKMTTLGEVVDIKGGKRLPMGKSLVVQKTSHPYIRITDIENNKIKKNQLQFITDDVFSSISRYIVNSGDVIVSIVGSIGFVAIIDDDLDKASLTENCVKFVNLKNLDSKFLYYFLTSGSGQNEIERNTIGAVQKKLPIYGVQNIKIFLPSFPEQRAIAAVLSSLDDKIELLREQNKTLEAIAQAIFKEWFVNFNFPGATGKMIDSELGKIPEGWEVKKFGDVFKIEYGRSDKKFDEDGEFPVYGAGGIVGYSNSNDYQGYQIIVGCRGTCGNITLAYEDSKITHNSLVVANEWFNPFSYLFLQTIDIKRAITGSTQPQITIGDLANIEIYVPEDLIIKLFSENIKSIFEKIKNNSSQIQTLSSLRDTLLPKLMKGEVRVKGFIE
mgnify:CR=1 FL=1